MAPDDADKLIPLAIDRPIWDRFFGVFPAFPSLVGTENEDAEHPT